MPSSWRPPPRLAVDDARPRAQQSERLDDHCPVGCRASPVRRPCAIARNPSCLTLVQPQLPGWRGRGIGGEAWRDETRRQCTRIQRHRGHGIGVDRAVVNKPGRAGRTKLLKVALVLSTLPCRARIAKRPSNQVRRSPARRPMTGGFAGSFTLVRTWATRAYGREDRRCEWRTACAVPTSRIGVL